MLSMQLRYRGPQGPHAHVYVHMHNIATCVGPHAHVHVHAGHPSPPWPLLLYGPPWRPTCICTCTYVHVLSMQEVTVAQEELGLGEWLLGNPWIVLSLAICTSINLVLVFANEKRLVLKAVCKFPLVLSCPTLEQRAHVCMQIAR